MSDTLKILMLEDDPNDVGLIEMYLKRSDLKYEVAEVSTKEEFITALDHQEFDVILSDHQLPQFSSLEALQIRNSKKLTTPFILVTGTVSEEYAVTILHAGASDYILKDRLIRLPSAIKQAIQKQKNHLEKLEAEKELRRSNERFKYASKATSDAIWDYNVATRELIWAEGFETLFGYKLSELERDINSWVSHIHPDDKERVIKELYQAINSADQTVWSDQYRYIRNDGTIAQVVDKGIILREPASNKPYRMVGAVQDITELVKSNDDLKQFSFIVSHNLYAPLSNLFAIFNLFNYSTLDSYNREMVEMMKGSTENLKQTIDDLSKILIIKNIKVELENIEVKKVFDKVQSILYSEIEKAQPAISLNLEVPVIKSYSFYLESILQNLIDNSLKFRMPMRRLHITIRTKKILNARTLLTYADNACGIDIKRHKKNIFGMYQRFHHNTDGKGLGLFIVKSQVTALGGHIDLESEPGKGTTFKITL